MTDRGGENNGFWGQSIKKKKAATCARLGFQNINGISIENNIKTEELLQVIKEYEFDYLGLQEINTHERILAPQLKWKRRFPHPSRPPSRAGRP